MFPYEVERTIRELEDIFERELADFEANFRRKYKRKHPGGSQMRPVLAFNLFCTNKNFNCMATVQNLTLTSVAPVTLKATVVDASNNNSPIAGTLSGLSYTPDDATQDVAVVDPNDSTEVDLHAASNTGGTTVHAIGTFVSTLKKDDGTPAFNGQVTCDLVIVNNIPAAALNPVLTFNPA